MVCSIIVSNISLDAQLFLLCVYCCACCSVDKIPQQVLVGKLRKMCTIYIVRRTCVYISLRPTTSCIWNWIYNNNCWMSAHLLSNNGEPILFFGSLYLIYLFFIFCCSFISIHMLCVAALRVLAFQLKFL